MKKIWVNKANSFKAAEKFDRDYYFNMGAVKRLETTQQLREIYFNIKKVPKDRRRLQKVINVIQNIR